MKLAELADKPKLVKITLDSKEIIKAYKEPLEFYTWDRQPIKNFVKLANPDMENLEQMFDTVVDLIFDEDGNKILSEGATLPNPIMIQVISKVVETLGK